MVQYRWLTLIESAKSWRLVRRFLKQHQLVPSDVGVIVPRADLLVWLRQQYPTYVFVGLEEIESLKAVATDAYQKLGNFEQEFLQHNRTAFGWVTLFALYSQYLLQLESNFKLAQRLVSATHDHQTWLLIPAGPLWGGLEDMHDTTPLLFLVAHRLLKQAGRKVIVIGGMPWEGMHTFLLYSKTALNIVLLVPIVAVGLLLGAARREAGEVLVFFREPLGFSNVARFKKSLQEHGVSWTHIQWENIRLHDSPTLRASVGSLAAKLYRLMRVEAGDVRLARADQRSYAARWITVWLMPIKFRAGWQLLPKLPGVGREWRQTQQTLTALYWQQRPALAPLRSYTTALLATFLPDYLCAHLTLHSLLDGKKPPLALYPDGYAPLIRLVQWENDQGTCRGIEAPHGYPNRLLPRSYYRAARYLAPTAISERHLRRYDIPTSTILPVRDEWWDENIAAVNQHTHPASTPVVAVVFSGSYPYWSFPNLFYELSDLTVTFIKEITSRLPQAKIILKSHPNGSSPYFFAALLAQFPALVAAGKLAHISAGWPQPSDYAAIDVAVSFLAIPSTPTVLFLKQGIPLLVMSSPQTITSTNYPTVANLVNYPLLMGSFAEVVASVERLCTSGVAWHEAARSMQSYAEQILRPVGIHRPLLDEIVLQL